MISGYLQQTTGDIQYPLGSKIYAAKQAQKAMELFGQMLDNGVVPDSHTYSTLMSSYTDLNQAKELYGSLLAHKVELDRFVVVSLISMYSKCGSLEEAIAVFNQHSSKFKPDVQVWNAMIGGFGQHGEGHKSLEVFHQMLHEGIKPDEITITTILNACSHSGLVNEALSIFHSMESKFGLKPTAVHVTCLVDVLGRAGRLEETNNNSF
jgi:pentatricopeptide repeat protein